MKPITASTYVRPTPLEVAVGYLHGLMPATPLPHTSATPRKALDDAIRPALVHDPCHVSFSGGRDSSAVLAAATELARREGHQLPVPVTWIYPDVPDSHEGQWQEMVIRHLGLNEWIRIELTGDDADLLGPAARIELRRHGLLWPPAITTTPTMYAHLSPGSLLSGEGGDASLGLRRGTAITVLRHGRRPTPKLMKMAASELLPRNLRRIRAMRAVRHTIHAQWLTRRAMAMHSRITAEAAVMEPLRYDEATWFLTRPRPFSVLSHNQAVHAATFGLMSSDPLLDHGFLAALAHAGGRWGFNGRTATMRALFSDVLPPAVITRSTKASFNHAYRGEATRAFARSWDGSGVDHGLVDAEKLREVWLSENPTMATALLLHSAWLASGGTTP